MKDKTFFFLILALSCFWLVLDEFYGKNFISKFITKIVPTAESENTNVIIDTGNGHTVENVISQGTAKLPDGYQWDGEKWVGTDGSIYQ